MLERLAYLLLIATLAIVGIAMSSHSATPAGHSTSAQATMTADVMDLGHEHSTPITVQGDSNDVDVPRSACVDCADDHSGLLMACAFLALLVVVSLVMPAVALRFGLLAPGVSRVDDTPRRVAAPRPPDLSELCIDRQ